MFLSFRFQMCLLNSVLFLFLLSVKLVLCAAYLVLNDVAVSPTILFRILGCGYHGFIYYVFGGASS